MEDQYEERDDAETPKEFYTGVQDRGTPFVCEGDPDIEKLLWREEVIEYDISHGHRIRNLFTFGETPEEISETLNVPLNVVEKILEDAIRGKVTAPPYGLGNDDFAKVQEDLHLSAFQRTILWYENLRPIKKDLIMLAVASVIFTRIMILINTLM